MITKNNENMVYGQIKVPIAIDNVDNEQKYYNEKCNLFSSYTNNFSIYIWNKQLQPFCLWDVIYCTYSRKIMFQYHFLIYLITCNVD